MNPTPDEADTGEHVIPRDLAEALTPAATSVLAEVDAAGRSEAGRRPGNEDCFLVVRVDRTLQSVASNLPPGDIPVRFGEVGYGLLVADGVGGQAGGEVASRLAVGALVNMVLHSPAWIMRVGEPEADRILERIADRYRQVDAAMSEVGAADPALEKMATTLTLACSIGEELFVGHVGDSRAYLLRDGALIRLTRDHTFAQELADQGMIRQDEVGRHRLRHVLTKALSGRPNTAVAADALRVGLKTGDQVLLCTDGLTEAVSDEQITAHLIGAKTPAAACDALVEAALVNGKDNITAVVARYTFRTPG